MTRFGDVCRVVGLIEKQAPLHTALWVGRVARGVDDRYVGLFSAHSLGDVPPAHGYGELDVGKE